MSKRIEIDGHYFRLRRGRLVEIPPAWVGVGATKKEIRQRPSKYPRKLCMKRDRTYTPRNVHRYGPRIGHPQGFALRHSNKRRQNSEENGYKKV